MKRHSRWGLICVGSLLMGCAGTPTLDSAFASGWQWDQGKDADRLIDALSKKEAAAPVPAAVGITGHGLVGRALDGPLWTYEGEVDVLPSLVGDLVAFSGGGKVTGLDVRTGDKKFQFDVSERRLEGLGYDGNTSVLLLVDGNDARPDQIVIVNKHGQVRFSTTTLERVGTPAAVGGIGLVPWASQYVTALDLTTGEPIGRILVRDATSRVEARDREVYFFGRGAGRLVPELAKNPEWPSLRVPPLEFPGEPRWPLDGSKPRPTKARSVGVYGFPVPEGATLRFAGDTFLATYFDVLAGLDGNDGSVRWVTHFERSVIGAEAGRFGFLTCMEDGSLFHLRVSDGAAVPAGSLENRLRACVVTAPTTEVSAPARAAVEDQIHETIVGTGPNMATVHEFLVDQLGKRTGDAATVALLAIARDPLTSSPVIDRASRALASRTHGADAMIRALEESAPPPPPPRAPPAAPPATATPTTKPKPGTPAAKPTSPATAPATAPTTAPTAATPPATPPPSTPPLGPPDEEEDDDERPGSRRPRRAPPLAALATALAAMGETRAAPALALHLQNPALPARDAQALVLAITQLGDGAQAPLVLEFFLTFRTAGGDADFIEALALAGDFVWRQGSPEERAEIDRAARDSLTHPDLVKSLVAKLKVKKKKKTKPAAPAAAPSASPTPASETSRAPASPSSGAPKAGAPRP